jgi:hypothetical protein
MNNRSFEDCEKTLEEIEINALFGSQNGYSIRKMNSCDVPHRLGMRICLYV